MNLETAVKKLGFKDTKEFHRLNSGINLTLPGALTDYKAWKQIDGSKKGLLVLIKKYSNK